MIPLLYALGALLLGSIVPRVASVLLPVLHSTITVNAAIGIYSAIASGMITLTGIVFSLTIVMVQFSATAYSPRLVLWVVRDRVMSHAIGVFTATFLYALTALAWVDRGGSGKVPLIGELVVTALLILSIIMFICLLQRVALLQVGRMLIFTGNQGRRVIESLYPPLTATQARTVGERLHEQSPRVFQHNGEPKILQAVDIPCLTELAAKHECLIELVVCIGDAILETTPILHVYGADSPPESELMSAIELGAERTFEQDPKYALRLLVDIAIKALSPAINDPTTAVQALDQIEDLLIRLAHRRLEIGSFHDADGYLRLLVGFPTWEDFLRLAFDEILFCGATSIQVMRRMKALINELRSVLPEERRPALRQWEERLQSSVDRSFVDQQEKLDASAEDRQGLGNTRFTAGTRRLAS